MTKSPRTSTPSLRPDCPSPTLCLQYLKPRYILPSFMKQNKLSLKETCSGLSKQHAVLHYVDGLTCKQSNMTSRAVNLWHQSCSPGNTLLLQIFITHQYTFLMSWHRTLKKQIVFVVHHQRMSSLTIFSVWKKVIGMSIQSRQHQCLPVNKSMSGYTC